MEDRRLLAAHTINTLADVVDAADGVTSLREAILASNQTSGPDVIDFDAALTAGGPATILLAQGELKVTGDLAVNGPGANLLTIRAFDPTAGVMNGDGSRVFNIDDGTSSLRTVSISSLTLTGGDIGGEGGAIYSKEALTVTASTITGNHGADAGGGIQNYFGTLTVTDATISNNKSFSFMGGGGISSTGNTTLTRSNVSNNSAGDSGGGIWHRNGTLTLTDCTITANQTRINTTMISEGGGVWSTSNLIVTRCTISNNKAGYYQDFNANGGGLGGGVYARGSMTIADSTISGNTAIQGIRIFTGVYGYGGVGGGIYHSGGAATIAGSNISNNNAGYIGGGVVNYVGTLAITDCNISGNNGALYGGGVYSVHGNAARTTTTLTITRSTISGNTAEDFGGGIMSKGANLTIASSTISGNTVSGSGGGVFSDNTTASVSYSTITANTAGSDGGGIRSFGNLTMRHTIVAGNTRKTVPEPNDVTGNVIASFTLFGVDTGATIINSGGISTNLIGSAAAPINPLLGPLADNGGPTKTHALLPGSPAIDAGDPATTIGGTVPPSDQRGAPFGRILAGDVAGSVRIDIGAFELAPPRPSADFNDDQFIDGADFLAWQLGYGSTGAAATTSNGNADSDNDVDAADLAVWRSTFGNPALVAAAAPAASAGLVVGDSPSRLSPQAVDAAMAWQMAAETPASRPLFRPRWLRAR